MLELKICIEWLNGIGTAFVICVTKSFIYWHVLHIEEWNPYILFTIAVTKKGISNEIRIVTDEYHLDKMEQILNV
jgi:hypothetical protein